MQPVSFSIQNTHATMSWYRMNKQCKTWITNMLETFLTLIQGFEGLWRVFAVGVWVGFGFFLEKQQAFQKKY